MRADTRQTPRISTLRGEYRNHGRRERRRQTADTCAAASGFALGKKQHSNPTARQEFLQIHYRRQAARPHAGISRSWAGECRLSGGIGQHADRGAFEPRGDVFVSFGEDRASIPDVTHPGIEPRPRQDGKWQHWGSRAVCRQARAAVIAILARLRIFNGADGRREGLRVAALDGRRTKVTAPRVKDPFGRLRGIIFCASGLCALVDESVWPHCLRFFLGHAAYAQTLVLGIFMGGWPSAPRSPRVVRHGSRACFAWTRSPGRRSAFWRSLRRQETVT